jgi:hypothetical protein
MALFYAHPVLREPLGAGMNNGTISNNSRSTND